jgi:hypothetical protein
MKRLLLLLASLVALSASGCGMPGFEPGVGFYWNRKAGCPLLWFVGVPSFDDLEDWQNEVGPPAGGYPPGY